MKKLIDIIQEYGIENIRFLVPMHPIESILFISFTSSSTSQILMLCEIVEDRYKVKDNYKITLQSIEQFPKIKGKEHYYISDLEGMIREGTIQLLINHSKKLYFD